MSALPHKRTGGCRVAEKPFLSDPPVYRKRLLLRCHCERVGAAFPPNTPLLCALTATNDLFC